MENGNWEGLGVMGEEPKEVVPCGLRGQGGAGDVGDIGGVLWRPFSNPDHRRSTWARCLLAASMRGLGISKNGDSAGTWVFLVGTGWRIGRPSSNPEPEPDPTPINTGTSG